MMPLALLLAFLSGPVRDVALRCAPPAQSPRQIAFLQSAAGDRVDIRATPGQGGCIPPACADVRLCLENPAGNHLAKGISNASAALPDLVVRPDMTGCMPLAAVRQRITLWRAVADGTMVPVMVTELDLRLRIGQTIRLEWSAEPAPGSR